ncbi:MAG: hypothetical protein K8R36_07070 [Planctomycetales bacterium]|nr:hypothetical protein [Planctomycetales bacterium]
MGEENRSSSGSGAGMMVVAILGGILLVGCCGGVVAIGLGGSLLWVRSTPIGVQVQPPLSAPMPTQLTPEVTKALDELNKESEPIKITPDDGTPTAPIEPGSEKPEVALPPGTEGPGTETIPAAPSVEEKKV